MVNPEILTTHKVEMVAYGDDSYDSGSDGDNEAEIEANFDVSIIFCVKNKLEGNNY